MDIYNNTIRVALRKFGETRQLDKLIEECAELTQSLLKDRHEQKNNFTNSDVVNELADVYITLEYASEIYGRDNIQKAINAKMESLYILLQLKK